MLPALDLFLTAAFSTGVFLSPLDAADAPSSSAVDAASCPADMRLIDGDHAEAVQHECVAVKDNRCVAYRPGVARFAGRHEHVRVCMDQFEAPNVRGENPIVMLDSIQSAAWCAAKGKRLCSEYEWETACEGPEHTPWVYGYTRDPETCNSGKVWRPFDAYALMRGGDDAKQETARLWQGDPSGARPGCVSSAGVYDMNGNVEEWVRSSRPRQWPTALMGGFWAKAWTECRGTNAAHEPIFRFYEVGFRCCADASGD